MPWLNGAHRPLLRQACALDARMETGGNLSVSSTQALSAMLSKLGATLTDESTVSHRRMSETTMKASFIE